MLAYGQTVEAAGASVEWIPTGGDGGTDCVLLSQLSRMLLFQNRGLVRPDDVVVTMDVNAFVMSKKILDPVKFNPGKKVWIMQVVWQPVIPGRGERAIIQSQQWTVVVMLASPHT